MGLLYQSGVLLPDTQRPEYRLSGTALGLRDHGYIVSPLHPHTFITQPAGVGRVGLHPSSQPRLEQIHGLMAQSL